MLRLLVLLLLLLNGLYFAWSQRLLAGIGFEPVQQTEPQRLQQQISPDALRVVSTPELKVTESNPGKAPECLQAGPFDPAQSARLRAALTPALPPGTWTLEAVAANATLLRLPSADDQQRAQLDEIKTALANQPLTPCK